MTALHHNPFHILGASLDSTRREISQLAEEKALLQSEEDVRRARQELTIAQHRLSAEIAWLPGVKPDVIKQLVDYGRLDSDILQYAQIPVLSRANAYAAMFEERLAKGSQADWAILDLPRFLSTVDRIDAVQVAETINAHREVSGFPAVEVNVVRDALQDQLRYYLSIGNQVLQRMGLASRRAILLNALGGSSVESQLIHDLVDAYELDRSADIETRREALDDLAERIRGNPAIKGAPLFQFKSQFPSYAKVIQPILRSRDMRGLNFQPAESLVWKLREVAVEIANEMDALETSYEIVSAIRDAFSDVPSIQQIVANDIEQLEKILQQVRTDNAVYTPSVTAHRSHPRSAESTRPVPAPVQSLPQETQQSASCLGTFLRGAVVVGVLIFLIGLFSSDDDIDPGESNRSGGGVIATETREGSCDGIHEWWSETNNRVDRAYAAFDRVGLTTLQAERSSVQRQLRSLANEQRLSDPPPGALAYSRARVDEFELMASYLSATSSDATNWDQQFETLDERLLREGNATGRECDFRITWEQD